MQGDPASPVGLELAQFGGHAPRRETANTIGSRALLSLDKTTSFDLRAVRLVCENGPLLGPVEAFGFVFLVFSESSGVQVPALLPLHTTLVPI